MPRVANCSRLPGNEICQPSKQYGSQHHLQAPATKDDRPSLHGAGRELLSYVASRVAYHIVYGYVVSGHAVW